MLGHDECGPRIAFFLDSLARASQTLLRKGHCNVGLLVRLEFEHLSVSLVEFCVYIGKVRVVVNFANIHHVEVVDEIIPQHEKNSIIFRRVSHFLLVLSRYFAPEITIIIRGPALPLFLPPRVSDF